MFAQFAPWQPDRPAFGSTGMPFLRNAVPRPDGYYGPLRAPVSADANAMAGGACVGIGVRRTATVVDEFETIGSRLTNISTWESFATLLTLSSGVVFAGLRSTAAGGSKLYTYDEGTRTWADASKAGGYNIGTRDRVRFATFGNVTIAVAGSEMAPQAYSGPDAGGTFADLAGTPPAALDVAVVRDFLVLIEAERPNIVRWSAIGDPTNWPVPGTTAALSVQSDLQELRDGGDVVRVVPGVGGNDALVVGQTRMWRMNYQVGPIFRFDVAVRKGTYSPGSIAVVGGVMYFLAPDGFHAYDGGQLAPIGRGQVDAFFAADVAAGDDAAAAIEAAVDLEGSTVYWSYRSKAATGARNDRVIAFNYGTGRWGYGELDADAIATVHTGSGSLSSPLLVAVGPDLKLSTLAGATLEAELETAEVAAPDLASGYVRYIRPILDGDGSTLVEALVRDEQTQTPLETGWKVLERNGFAPIRRVGRYVRARVREPAGSGWTYAHGAEIDLMRIAAPNSVRSGRPRVVRTLPDGRPRNLPDGTERVLRS